MDHYGITIKQKHLSKLKGINLFDPQKDPLLNVPIDCTMRDSKFLVKFTGVGGNASLQAKVKEKYCGWFVENNKKFCPLVDTNPKRAQTDPTTGAIVRPRIWQTCHQECEMYTHCAEKKG